jgi:hypothetical protein
MTPEDKVLLLGLLFFSAEFDLLNKLDRATCTTAADWRRFGVPVQLDLLLESFQRARRRRPESTPPVAAAPRSSRV